MTYLRIDANPVCSAALLTSLTDHPLTTGCWVRPALLRDAERGGLLKNTVKPYISLAEEFSFCLLTLLPVGVCGLFFTMLQEMWIISILPLSSPHLWTHIHSSHPSLHLPHPHSSSRLCKQHDKLFHCVWESVYAHTWVFKAAFKM